jgi:hypothetical protein
MTYEELSRFLHFEEVEIAAVNYYAKIDVLISVKNYRKIICL